MPRRTRSAVLSPVSECPSYRISPRGWATIPMIAFIVVDLPEALPPEQANDLARAIAVIDRFQDVQVAVIGIDARNCSSNRGAPRDSARITSSFWRTSAGVPSAIFSP